jgi:hypothetical protein
MQLGTLSPGDISTDLAMGKRFPHRPTQIDEIGLEASRGTSTGGLGVFAWTRVDNSVGNGIHSRSATPRTGRR